MKKRFYASLWAFLCLGMPGFTLGAATPEINLYGHLVSSNQADEAQGIYQFTNGQTAGFTKVAELAAEPNAGAVKAGDLYYVFNIANQGDYGKEYSMYIYDPSDNYTLVTRTLTTNAFMTEAQVVAYDPSTKKIFCAYNDPYYGNRLGTINVSNRTRDFVASLGYNKFITLSFDSQGKLYGITNVGALYEINKTSGETRYIGSTGVSPADYQQAATFAGKDDNTLYWAECASTQGALYAVNVATAKATLIKTFAQDEEFATLWAGSTVVQDAAPAAAGNLKIDFAGGALNGQFTFTVPTSTHNRQPLTGTLNYTVKIDGQEQATGTAQAGAQVSCTVTTTQGYHDFSVVVSNEAGDSDEAMLKKQYIGNDTPGMVKNVRLTRGDAAHELVLTWDAPDSGSHGGYFDPATVKYKVRRMPTDIVVSEQATSPFVEIVESDKPARCFYDVIPYVDENTQGIAMSSNKIMIGTPFTVPYSEDFTSNDNVTSFTIEDSNNDGTTWEHMYDYGYMRIWSSEKVKDEWLFTPFIGLEKNAEYKLSFDVRSLSNEKMEVKMGGDAASGDMENLLIEEFEVTDYEWKNMQCTFTVGATKPWFIGFHCTTTDIANALAIYLDNIKIEKTGEAPQTGIQEVESGKLFSIDGHQLTLTAATAMNTAIYTIDGRTAFNGTLLPRQAVQLESGIYIVVMGNKTSKVVVR